MKEFFLVADWGAYNYLYVPNIMLSAGSIANAKGTEWQLSRTRLHALVEKVIVDSGGYSFFSRWGDYPFSLEKYLDLVYYIKDKYPLFSVATLDYPCEPNINRDNLVSNQIRIEKTVSNAIKCFQADKNLPWLPVIQGYALDEYLSCIDLYKEVGITSNYWAIGSICSRKGKPLELRKIITSIKEQHPNAKLHAFGLGIPFLRDPQIFQAIYSSDSSAWNWGISGDNMRERKLEAALNYFSQIEDMIEGAQDQTCLTQFFW